MNKSCNTHHIVPSSRWGSNVKINKVRLDTRHHAALHMLFNNWTPKEQIERLMNINCTALSEQFKHDVRMILSQPDDYYFYQNGVLRPNY